VKPLLATAAILLATGLALGNGDVALLAAAPPAKPWEGAEGFAEVKPYQPGDPLRRVNWRAFAKTGELYVNKYAGSERGRAVVVVDARRLRGAVVEAAAKAAAILAERGYDVSYFVLGHGEAQEVPKSFTPSCTGRPPAPTLWHTWAH